MMKVSQFQTGKNQFVLFVHEKTARFWPSRAKNTINEEEKGMKFEIGM